LIAAVIGSRSFNDYDLLERTLDQYQITSIVSGGASGADSLAEHYAKKRNITIRVIKPDWSLGRHAGMLRNTEIVESSDIVFAFWDGQSKGTLDSIKKAARLNKQCVLIQTVRPEPSPKYHNEFF
jgi:hypothetical protein